MDTPDQILIVDDDYDISILLAGYLEKNGYRVLTAADGKGMHKILDHTHIDLIVLDLNLPGEDGLTLCRNLRVRSNIPIIMLTARSEPFDRILGLEMAADDYLRKPFEPRELFACIRSVLRRAQALPSAKEHLLQQMRFAGWTMDFTARHLIGPDGVVVALSGAEYRLMKIFLEHADHVLSRDQLLNLTQGRDADPFDRSIDLQISRLQQKLGEDARATRIIKTVRNEGYVLATGVMKDTKAE